jgi:hypothetical protein
MRIPVTFLVLGISFVLFWQGSEFFVLMLLMCFIFILVLVQNGCGAHPASSGYRGSFPGVKLPGRGVDHPPPFNAVVKENVELCHYVPSRPAAVCCSFPWRYNPLWLYFHSPVAGFSLLVFARFLHHTQRRATVSRTSLDE